MRGGDSSVFSASRLIHIFPISTKMWWFLTEYFIILILSPILNKGIVSLSKKDYVFILIVLVIINSFGLYITRNSLGSNFLSLLILYLIGRFFNLYKVSIDRRTSIVIWSVSTLMLVLLLVLSRSIDLRITWLLLMYNNPLIILQAFAILFFALSFPERHNRFLYY